MANHTPSPLPEMPEPDSLSLLDSRFVERYGEIFRVLLESQDIAWLISHENPCAPFRMSKEELSRMNRCPTPESFLTNGVRTGSQITRYRLIEPLLADSRCITDRQWRATQAKTAAQQNDTTTDRILQLYYRYLATGCLIVPRKPKTPAKRADFDWAIRTYYYSATKFSLRGAFEMLLVRRFTGADGNMLPNAPTWHSFRHYFYNQNYHKNPQKIIAREGLTKYQRDYRPAFGSASGWKPVPGAYQMDATAADIYLVSRFDHTTVIGRPNIYLAVDTASQLIAGVYVGLNSDESAVMTCLANAVEDKVAFCARFGVKIAPSDWSCSGLPYECITDRGNEFFGERMQELCRRYGIEIHSLPPFRPDEKGLVEMSFDLIQEQYKPLLRGKGVIEEDAQERWSVDYRAQATLDLDEFSSIIIHCVVYLNSARVLSNGKTPAQLWMMKHPNMLEVDAEEIQRMALPRVKAKLTRKGFRVNALMYAPSLSDARNLVVGDTYTVACDSGTLDSIYIVLETGWIPCRLVPGCAHYRGLSQQEGKLYYQQEQKAKKEAKEQETEASVKNLSDIRAIIQMAENRGGASGKQSSDEIRRSRKEEEGKLT